MSTETTNPQGMAALLAEVDALPDPERSLLSHNERVLIEFARRLTLPIRALGEVAEMAKRHAAYIETTCRLETNGDAAQAQVRAVGFLRSLAAMFAGDDGWRAVESVPADHLPGAWPIQIWGPGYHVLSASSRDEVEASRATMWKPMSPPPREAGR